ncbi:hypothetical protein RU92_GL002523 [Lactococcus cremoris subsp. tructae]|uniref:Uncharacterized protein n=1 Tax=Lactococcus cremoris subsp. tructae TaxID=542833 RepID=A0A2A5SRP1_LACLC|nr:hypothetical protein RU92_GL002523 [Lactococcus cremoris subsp. tructae]
MNEVKLFHFEAHSLSLLSYWDKLTNPFDTESDYNILESSAIYQKESMNAF